MKRFVLICSFLLGGLLVPALLMAQYTLESGATVKDSRVFKLRDSVIVKMQVDLSGMDVKSNRSVVLIPSFAAGEQSLVLPSIEVMGRRRNLYYERNGLHPYAENPCLS